MRPSVCEEGYTSSEELTTPSERGDQTRQAEQCNSQRMSTQEPGPATTNLPLPPLQQSWGDEEPVSPHDDSQDEEWLRVHFEEVPPSERSEGSTTVVGRV